MVDKKLIFNRLKATAEEQIKNYEDSLFISKLMLTMAERELRKISGMYNVKT